MTDVPTTPGDWSDLLDVAQIDAPFVPKLAEVFTTREPSQLWQIAPQLGVTTAVTGVPEGPDLPPAWDFDHLRAVKERFDAEGISIPFPQLHIYQERLNAPEAAD